MSRAILPLLRGINLGGWLMMEGYILGGKNIPENVFKQSLSDPQEFTRRFREGFFQPADVLTIKKLGFNCVRLPFNYRLLEEPDGFSYLEKVISWFAAQKIYVVLDMHAVPGSQNPDWHSDSSGPVHFWENSGQQQKFVALWHELARTFKNEEWIAGYDLMNEPVLNNSPLLPAIYQRAIEVVRSTGDQHIIFLEGNNWAREIEFVKEVKGDNLALSIHFYEPIDFTFNQQPETYYPGEVAGERWNKPLIEKKMKVVADFAAQYNLPVLVGEFGVVSRESTHGELQWVKDLVEVMNKYCFHWTYWTYKAVKGMSFPDGLFQWSGSRDLLGFENLPQVLKTRPDDFFQQLPTKNFILNQSLYQRLKPQLLL